MISVIQHQDLIPEYQLATPGLNWGLSTVLTGGASQANSSGINQEGPGFLGVFMNI